MDVAAGPEHGKPARTHRRQMGAARDERHVVAGLRQSRSEQSADRAGADHRDPHRVSPCRHVALHSGCWCRESNVRLTLRASAIANFRFGNAANGVGGGSCRATVSGGAPRTSSMSALGHKRTLERPYTMSALPPKADIRALL